MIEPLSITGSVLTLLGLCWNVGRSLKSFHDGASIVESAVFELLQDVEGLAGVLEAMKNTVCVLWLRPLERSTSWTLL